MSHSADSRSRVSVVAACLVAVIAAVHLEQYVDFISEVPTVGVLFVLNAAGGAGLAVALIGRDRPLRLLAAMGSIGLAAGSLISIAIALTGNFFGYSEPTLRLPILIAIIAEVAALPVLVVLMTAELRVWRTGQTPSAPARGQPPSPPAST
ncbi:MAG: hypothetical protein M3Y09_01265 [Actinomycetota bacterium]|nr:hypothetical protein [Actinomycetota bacterium]